MGVLQVGRAFVQYAQPLASGSRPSWSRRGSERPGPEPTSDHNLQAPIRSRAGPVGSALG